MNDTVKFGGMGEWFIPSLLKSENRRNVIHQFESDFLLKCILNTQMEVVRMDEETALKAAGCKSFGGSIPFASANGEFRRDRWSLFVWKTKTRVMMGLFRLQNSPQICGD